MTYGFAFWGTLVGVGCLCLVLLVVVAECLRLRSTNPTCLKFWADSQPLTVGYSNNFV